MRATPLSAPSMSAPTSGVDSLTSVFLGAFVRACVSVQGDSCLVSRKFSLGQTGDTCSTAFTVCLTLFSLALYVKRRRPLST